MKASDRQEGGQHYKNFPIQPAEFCQRNRLNWCEANVVKYVCRHAEKKGAEDLRKAKHYIDLLLEWEYPEPEPEASLCDSCAVTCEVHGIVTADGTCNRYESNLRERVLDAKQEAPLCKTCGVKDCESADPWRNICSLYVARQEAKPSLCHSCRIPKCDKPLIERCEMEGVCAQYVPEAKQEATLPDMGCATTDCCNHSMTYLRNCAAYLPGAMRHCEQYTTAKQEAPTAAEQTATHTDPSTNCRDCGNTLCVGIGRNLTCDQGCERFFAKKETWTRYDIWQKIEKENARSKEIHGSWHNCTPDEQKEAICAEFREWRDAYEIEDVDGEHGEVAELVQIANLCFRRIQFLTGEADA